MKRWPLFSCLGLHRRGADRSQSNLAGPGRSSAISLFTFGVAVMAIGIGASFRNGKGDESGVIREYHSTGKLASETRVDARGQPHGAHRAWYDDGTLRQEGRFARGHVVAMRDYRRSGRLSIEKFEGRNYELVIVSHPDE